MNTSRRPWLMIAGAVAVGVAAALIFSAPVWKKALVRGEMTRTLNNVRQLQIATQMMALDTAQSGENPKGSLPADLGIKTAREYYDRLVKDNYLSEGNSRKITKDLLLVNASSSDPRDTAFVISKSFLDLKEGLPAKGFVVFTLGGSGGVYSRKSDLEVVKLPNRQQQILPDE